MTIEQEIKAELYDHSNTYGAHLMATWYGSQKPNSDKDILIVTTQQPPNKMTQQNNLDISNIGIQKLITLLNLKDIEYTEPILTGTNLCNPTLQEELREQINDTEPSTEAETYLIKRSIECMLQADCMRSQAYLKQYIQGINHGQLPFAKETYIEQQGILGPDINNAMHAMTYSLSYLAAALRYRQKENNITLTQLREEQRNPVEKQLNNLLTMIKKYQPHDLWIISDAEQEAQLSKKIIRTTIQQMRR